MIVFASPAVAVTQAARWLCVAVVVITCSASEVQGQSAAERPDATATPGTLTVAGIVRDAADRPLAGAEARLDPKRAALTDSAGRFALRGVPAEKLTLTVRRIGYRPVSVSLAPSAPQVRFDVEVKLTASSYQLPEVLVEGKAYDKGLWDVGFYHRQQVGFGKYFDPDYMQHFGGADLTTLAREAGRVDVRKYGSHYYAYGRIAGNACRMHIYVDGAYRREAMSGFGRDKGVGLDELVPKEDVYAVEVYPNVNSVPSEYVRVGPRPGLGSPRPAARIPSPIQTAPPSQDDENLNNDAACGAIVIWTKWHMAAIARDSSRAARPRP